MNSLRGDMPLAFIEVQRKIEATQVWTLSQMVGRSRKRYLLYGGILACEVLVSILAVNAVVL